MRNGQTILSDARLWQESAFPAPPGAPVRRRRVLTLGTRARRTHGQIQLHTASRRSAHTPMITQQERARHRACCSLFGLGSDRAPVADCGSSAPVPKFARRTRFVFDSWPALMRVATRLGLAFGRYEPTSAVWGLEPLGGRWFGAARSGVGQGVRVCADMQIRSACAFARPPHDRRTAPSSPHCPDDRPVARAAACRRAGRSIRCPCERAREKDSKPSRWPAACIEPGRGGPCGGPRRLGAGLGHSALCALCLFADSLGGRRGHGLCNCVYVCGLTQRRRAHNSATAPLHCAHRATSPPPQLPRLPLTEAMPSPSRPSGQRPSVRGQAQAPRQAPTPARALTPSPCPTRRPARPPPSDRRPCHCRG